MFSSKGPALELVEAKGIVVELEVGGVSRPSMLILLLDANRRPAELAKDGNAKSHC